MIKRFGIVAKPRLTAVSRDLPALAAWLEARGVEPVFDEATADLSEQGGLRRVTRDDLPRHVDLILLLGGDGTLLGMADRAAQAGIEVPILGVNFGGLSLFPGAEDQLFFVAPRFLFPLGTSVDVAFGVLYGGISGEEEGGGIVYGGTTVGSPYMSLKVGLGYGFTGEDIAEDPVLLLGFEAQLSNSMKFISENWIVPGSEVVPISFGIRFFGEHLAADFALFYPLGVEDTEGFPFLPWIGFAYNFGFGN